ncbi:MAG: hypothetical protein H5T43_01505 [Methanomethylovorans sp.]|jgi:hypothetical protein|nr:hypothetical protein [Methanomethylovorans sp.]
MEKKSAIAIFLAVIMVGSIIPLIFSGSSNNNSNQKKANSAQDINTIPGNKVNYRLNSIADGISMSPEGITSAQFVDYAKMHRSQLKVFVPNETELSTLYNVNLTKEFFAVDLNASDENYIAFRAHEIRPSVVNFNYMISGQPYNGYYLLSRGNGYYNVVGSPMLFGSKNMLEKVIDVLSGNASGVHDFDYLLSNVEEGAEFQIISSENKEVADQYYLEFRSLEQGGYARTAMFLNLNASIFEKINALAQNSTTRGLEYNITRKNNLTKVTVQANESSFFNLAFEPSI